MNHRTPYLLWIFTVGCAGFMLIGAASHGTLSASDDEPSFYRAINLNGPALEVDDHQWEAGDARGVSCDDASFENQSIRLNPATDGSRTRMIRSSRWSPERKARIRISELTGGTYSVYLYVWEDNNPQTFDIRLNDKLVAKSVNSGKAGHWQRLGPWVVDVTKDWIELTADGGHANLSGLEIWRGRLADNDHPLETSPQTKELGHEKHKKARNNETGFSRFYRG